MLSAENEIMSNKKDPNKKHYFQAVSLEEFAEKMVSLSFGDKPFAFTIWEKGENEDKAEVYHLESFMPNSKTLNLKPTGKLVTKITGSTKTGKMVLVKIPIDSRTHFFTSGILKFHGQTLTYSIDLLNEIFKSQQRGKFRLNSSELIPIQFKIDEQVFDALDISTGGTSFQVANTQLERFAKGKIFKECTLRFDRKNYYIPQAFVAAHIPILDESGTPTNQTKVGISFKDLPRKTEDELHIKIATEARGEEMKKKFDSIVAKKTNED